MWCSTLCLVIYAVVYADYLNEEYVSIGSHLSLYYIRDILSESINSIPWPSVAVDAPPSLASNIATKIVQLVLSHYNSLPSHI